MTRCFVRIFVLCSVVVLYSKGPGAQTLSMQGQLSTWFTLNDGRPSTPSAGVRYVPTLSVERPLPESRLIDGELSVNLYGFGESPGWDDLDTTGRLKAYRAWARFKTSRFEARGGLQKINFGSALLLRPLRWFDSVDPRDPLQITDGVYGLLVRESPNNFTVWAWGLYGNDGIKGRELNPTREGTPEFGGRFQVPLFKGETAFTTHYRRPDVSKGLPAGTEADPLAREHRYALDGKWDVGIGVWFEGTAIRLTRPGFASRDTTALTVGADYTFALGNGLHLLGEYLVQDSSSEISEADTRAQFAAYSVSYPLNLLDNISAIVYVDAERRDFYRFVNWQRTYDRWQFYLMGFWNPRFVTVAQAPTNPGASQLAGKGVQIMAVFNHGGGTKP